LEGQTKEVLDVDNDEEIFEIIFLDTGSSSYADFIKDG
jgi:hypothetical protein